MSNQFVTIVGTDHYFGTSVFKVGQTVYGVKEPDNEHDQEAIKIVTDTGVTLGYIANSIYTVAKGCHSAGRVLDTFEDRLLCQVQFIVKNVVIAQIIRPEQKKSGTKHHKKHHHHSNSSFRKGS